MDALIINYKVIEGSSIVGGTCLRGLSYFYIDYRDNGANIASSYYSNKALIIDCYNDVIVLRSYSYSFIKSI